MGSNLIENGEVSMLDVLNEDNELEAEANAVLGDSDDQNCTYVKVLCHTTKFSLDIWEALFARVYSINWQVFPW